jgi:hypothetical protein
MDAAEVPDVYKLRQFGIRDDRKPESAGTQSIQGVHLPSADSFPVAPRDVARRHITRCSTGDV